MAHRLGALDGLLEQRGSWRRCRLPRFQFGARRRSPGIRRRLLVRPLAPPSLRSASTTSTARIPSSRRRIPCALRQPAPLHRGGGVANLSTNGYPTRSHSPPIPLYSAAIVERIVAMELSFGWTYFVLWFLVAAQGLILLAVLRELESLRTVEPQHPAAPALVGQ